MCEHLGQLRSYKNIPVSSAVGSMKELPCHRDTKIRADQIVAKHPLLRPVAPVAFIYSRQILYRTLKNELTTVCSLNGWWAESIAGSTGAEV